jgi:hypothetical protein
VNRLYILHAYQQAPLVRETRLVSDLTMPARDWTRYEEPAAVRNPGYVQRARERAFKRRPKVCALIRRQAG